MLSNCNVALDQGRLTWRHNSVLLTLIEQIQPSLRDNFVIYSDLPGFTAPHGGVIPPHVLVTSLRPDMCIINEIDRVIIIFELTCPWDSNIERSHSYKEGKYAPLIADLSHDFSVFNYSIEVSARGQISKENRLRLRSFLFKCCADPRNISKPLLDVASKAALLSSYSIFCARSEPTWENPAPLVLR